MFNLFEMLASNVVASAILAVVVFGISRHVRRPALTHCLWVIVLLKLITPGVMPLRVKVPSIGQSTTIAAVETPLRRPNTPSDVETSAATPQGHFESYGLRATSPGEDADHEVDVVLTRADVGATTRETTEDVPAFQRRSWSIQRSTLVPVTLSVWLVSSLAVLCITIARGYSFWCLLRVAKPAPQSLQHETKRQADVIGLQRCPRVLLLDANVSPMVWAPLCEPKLLFPEQLLGSLQPDALRALLLHELSHLKRRDHWVRLLELVTTALYWWYPVLWWARREIRVAEEQCCDSWVVSKLPHIRAVYATGLVQTIGFLSRTRTLPVAASGVGGIVEIEHRVKMIMTEDQPRRLSRLARCCLFLFAVSFLSALPLIEQPQLPAQDAAAIDEQPKRPRRVQPLAGLQRENISKYELRVAGEGNAAKAPSALVGILGDSRLKHWSHVGHVAFSPDGRLVASSSGDGTVRFWDPDSGEEVKRLHGRPLWENGPSHFAGLAFSPDGRKLAAAGAHVAVFLWDVDSGDEIRVIQGETPVTSVAFHPTQPIIATGHEMEARLWNADTGEAIHILQRDPGDFRRQYTTDLVHVAFTPDGDSLVVGHPDGTIRFWDVSSGEFTKTLDVHVSRDGRRVAVMCMAYDADGTRFAVGYRDGTVKVWHANFGGRIRSFKAHKEYVQAVAFHPTNENIVATGGLGGQIKYWALDSGQLQQEFTGSRHVGVCSMSFRPDGKMLASGGLSVRLWNAATGKPRFKIKGHHGMIESLTVGPDGRSVMTAGNDGLVIRWDTLSGSILRQLDVGRSVAGAAVSDDGRQVATLEWGSRALKVWNLETSELTESWTLGGQLGRSVVFSPDGRWLAASTRGIRSGQLAIIDLATGKMKGQIAIGKGTHMFSPDGERVIVAASTGTFRDREALLSMWDVASLKEEFKESFQGMPGVRAAALSSDGKMLAVAGISYDNSDESTNVVVLWDVTRKKTRLIIDLGEKVPSQLAMSPDGRSLVTLPWRGSELRVWDPRDGRLRETIQVRQPSHLRLHVQDIEFARDSRHLAAAMGNGTVYLLRIQEPSTAVQLKSTELSSPQSPEALPRDIWKDLIGKPAPEFEGVRSWPPRIPGNHPA